MRARSSLFGAFDPITVGQALSSLVPPAKPLSDVDAVSSLTPYSVQPPLVSVIVWYGAVPVQVVGENEFQSVIESGARFASSSSKPAATPTDPLNRLRNPWGGVTCANETLERSEAPCGADALCALRLPAAETAPTTMSAAKTTAVR